MGVIESVSKGFAVTKKSFGLIFLLFVFSAIFNVLNVVLSPAAAPNSSVPPSPAMVAVGVVFLFLTIYFQAGSMAYVRDSVKTGSAALPNFLAGGKYYIKLFLLGLVIAAVVGVTVLLGALAAGLLGAISPFLGVPVTILVAAFGLYLVVMLFLSPYAVVVDEKGVRAALKTSMGLVKKNILVLLGITLLMVAIGFGVGMVLGAILAGISALLKAPMATQIAFAVLSSLVNSVLGVLVTAAFTVFYLSLPERNNI